MSPKRSLTWKPRKQVEFPEEVYNRLNNAIPVGMQAYIIGAIIEDFLDTHDDDLEGSIARLVTKITIKRSKNG